MINFKCPGCSHAISVPEKYAERKTKCNECNSSITVPMGSNASPSEARPLVYMVTAMVAGVAFWVLWALTGNVMVGAAAALIVSMLSAPLLK